MKWGQSRLLSPPAPSIRFRDARPRLETDLRSAGGARQGADLGQRAWRWRYGALTVFALAAILAFTLGELGRDGNGIRPLASVDDDLRALVSGDDAALSDALGLAVRAAYEGGDLPQLAQADRYLTEVRKRHRNDSTLMADHALIIGAEAEALQRWAGDLDHQVEESRGEGMLARVLENIAADKRSDAEALLVSARQLAAQAEERAPSTLPPLRALALYHWASGHVAQSHLYLEQARALMRANGRDDPWTLAIEAATIAGDIERADAHALDSAAASLRRAVELAPSFLQARVKLARVLIARGALDDARRELEIVLGTAPAHYEAGRLVERLEGFEPLVDSRGIAET